MKKKILITGASRGFGKLAVHQLLSRGHDVLAALRGGEERGKSLFTASELASGRLNFVDLHVDDEESIRSVPKWLKDHWQGSLDVLVNNAGYGLMGPLEHQTNEQIRRQMEVNFFGPLALIRHCLPMLKKSAEQSASPRIINLSSIAGLVSFPYYGAYNASKFALEAVSESLTYELAPFGIQVALIEPGGFSTEFNQAVEFAEVPPTDKINSARSMAFQTMIKNKSKKFGGNPEKVASLIVKLCEKKRVGLRHVIGKDATTMVVIKRCLPDSWRVAFESLFFEKTFFRN